MKAPDKNRLFFPAGLEVAIVDGRVELDWGWREEEEEGLGEVSEATNAEEEILGKDKCLSVVRTGGVGHGAKRQA